MLTTEFGSQLEAGILLVDEWCEFRNLRLRLSLLVLRSVCVSSLQVELCQSNHVDHHVETRPREQGRLSAGMRLPETKRITCVVVVVVAAAAAAAVSYVAAFFKSDVVARSLRAEFKQVGKQASQPASQSASRKAASSRAARNIPTYLKFVRRDFSPVVNSTPLECSTLFHSRGGGVP